MAYRFPFDRQIPADIMISPRPQLQADADLLRAADPRRVSGTPPGQEHSPSEGPYPSFEDPKKNAAEEGGGVQDFATCSAEQVPKLRVWVFLRRFRRLLTAA